jgi:transposase
MIEFAGIEACPLSEWLHRGLREAGIPIEAIVTRQGGDVPRSGEEGDGSGPLA